MTTIINDSPSLQLLTNYTYISYKPHILTHNIIQYNIYDYLILIWITMIIIIILVTTLPYISILSYYGKLHYNTKNQLNQSISSYLSIHTQVAFTLYYLIGSILNGQLIHESIYSNNGIMTQYMVHAIQIIQSFFNNNNNQQSIHTHIPELGTLIVMCLLQLQLLTRLYECLTVHKSHNNKQSKQNILITIGGLLFYILQIVTLYIEGNISTNAYNPYVVSLYDQFNSLLFKQVNVWLLFISLAIYGIGYIKQRNSHRILAKLRTSKQQPSTNFKQSNKQKSLSKASKLLGIDTDTIQTIQSENITKQQYSTPYSDWFELLSMPHYTAEIMIYLSYFIIRSNTIQYISITQLLILLWVTINLCITGYRSHKWYIHTFSDYPKNRYAVIPYIL